MGKRKFQLTETEIKAFKRREQGSSRVDELKRLQAVRLYGSAYAMSSITEMLNCAEHSVRLWVLDYQRGGLEALLSQYQHSAQNARRLSLEQEAELKDRLCQYQPKQILDASAYRGTGEFWTVESLQAVVLKWYALTYTSLASYRNLFQHCGFSYQKTSGIYKSRPSEQSISDFEAEFEKQLLISSKIILMA